MRRFGVVANRLNEYRRQLVRLMNQQIADESEDAESRQKAQAARDQQHPIAERTFRDGVRGDRVVIVGHSASIEETARGEPRETEVRPIDAATRFRRRLHSIASLPSST